MIRLTPRQVRELGDQALASFPARVRAHWYAHHPGVVGRFSADELIMISKKAVELGVADPGHTEASVVLSADLWLYELARRRRIGK